MHWTVKSAVVTGVGGGTLVECGVRMAFPHLVCRLHSHLL
uniref:Uncharacterized protein n=1 Tax=Ascaris lumbricoides TaxID=6252 RepID=A0A0M3IM77_ASCLU